MAHNLLVFMAGMLLERFWAKGATTWDECFETPHACVTQIAVDIDGLVPVSPAEHAVVSNVNYFTA